MVITDLLPGAPWVFLLAILIGLLFFSVFHSFSNPSDLVSLYALFADGFC